MRIQRWLAGVEWVENLAAVRLFGLDPVAHASDVLIRAQLQQLFLAAVAGAQPWYSMVQNWPHEVKGYTDEDVRLISSYPCAESCRRESWHSIYTSQLNVP